MFGYQMEWRVEDCGKMRLLKKFKELCTIYIIHKIGG